MFMNHFRFERRSGSIFRPNTVRKCRFVELASLSIGSKWQTFPTALSTTCLDVIAMQIVP